MYGDFLPRHIFGKFHILCAMLRNIYCSLRILFSPRSILNPKFQIFLVDQISIAIPILKMNGSSVLFYCHFPDQLLSIRKSGLKSVYRIPFDWLEKRTTLAAHKILVNSVFTKNVTRATFAVENLTVLYPPIKLSNSMPTNQNLKRLAEIPS